jgi:transposase InsO family protein
MPPGYLLERAGQVRLAGKSAGQCDLFEGGARLRAQKRFGGVDVKPQEPLVGRHPTTTPELGHKIYPYLLRGIEITRPSQVWAMDITYIPMARGFVYLAVVLEWFSRRVLSWRLSITDAISTSTMGYRRRSWTG